MKQALITSIGRFLSESNYNRLPDSDQKYFDDPLMRCADINDPMFAEMKTLIGDFHLTPQEAFDEVFGVGSLQAGTVISLVLPVSEFVRKSNRRKDLPSQEWAGLRSYGDEELMVQLAQFVGKYIESVGGRVVTPVLAEKFRKLRVEDGPTSNWSERHIAYVTGHGTFSLNDGFITERGIAVRFISFVTDLVMIPDKRTNTIYNENCLLCSKGTCGACIKRCPVGAISKEGHDKMKCYAFAYGEASRQLAVEYGGIYQYGAGCGLCQVGVPCEFKIPKVG